MRESLAKLLGVIVTFTNMATNTFYPSNIYEFFYGLADMDLTISRTSNYIKVSFSGHNEYLFREVLKLLVKYRI